MIEVSFEKVTVREHADLILKYNPAAIVPTLILDGGLFLTETRLICEYFEEGGPGGFLAKKGDLDGRHWEGLINNFLDGVAVWVREIRRPVSEQSPSTLKLEENRSKRCLNHFENHWDTGANSLSYSSTMLASAIELIDTRLSLGWRSESPKLADWYKEISENNLLRLTAPNPI